MILLLMTILLQLPIYPGTTRLRHPLISEVTPNSFVQDTDQFRDKTIPITITGYNLWPYDNTTDRFGERQVYVLLRQRGGYVRLPTPIRGRAGDKQTLKTYFRSREWLQDRAPLQVQVQVDGRASQPYTLTVLPAPTGLARISSISPNNFSANPRGAPEQYRFRLYANNIDDESRLTLRVNNQVVPVDRLELRSGWLEATVPKNLWNKPGRYTVRLQTRRGTSVPQYIAILPAHSPVPSRSTHSRGDAEGPPPLQPVPARDVRDYRDRRYDNYRYPSQIIRTVPGE